MVTDGFNPKINSKITDEKASIVHNLRANRYGHYLSRQRLEKKILSNISNENYITLIHGKGGIGKSALIYNIIQKVLEREYTFRKEVDKIFWFSDADHPGQLTIQTIINDIKFACGLKETAGSYLTIEQDIASIGALFSRDKISIIVIDNFETVSDKNVFDFVCNPPEGCKIILTSKYPRHYFESNGVFSSRMTCINDVFMPDFSYEEWREVFDVRADESDVIAEWSKFLSKDNILETILRDIYEKLKGNVWGMNFVVSQFANQGVYNQEEIHNSLEKFVGESVYTSIYDRIIGNSWNLLNDNARKVLIAATLQGGISYLSLSEICELTQLNDIGGNSPILGSPLATALLDCQDLIMIDCIVEDRKRNYYVTSLVYQFVMERLINDELNEYKYIIDAWIYKYSNIAKGIGFCFDDTKRMQILDDPSKQATLLFLLNYCFDKERYEEFILISEELRYFFYTRTIWTTGDECIHIKRANAARKLGKKVQEFDALVYYMNIASKYKQLDSIDKYMDRTYDILDYGDIPAASVFRYNHARALYFMAKNNHDMALGIWDKILHETDLSKINVHDLDAAKRWRLKCASEYSKINSKKMIEYCVDALNEAKKHGFERGIVDLTLMLIDELLKQGSREKCPSYFDGISSLVVSINDLIYLARYHLCYAIYYEDTDAGWENLIIAYELFQQVGIEVETTKFFNRIKDIPYFYDRLNLEINNEVEVIFIRHIPTDNNLSDLFIGRLDLECNDEFIKQHQLEIATTKKYINGCTAIFSSPLKRAITTANLLMGNNTVVCDDRIIERELGVWGNQSKQDVQRRYPNAFYPNGDLNFFVTPLNGESFVQLIKRVSNFLEDITNNCNNGNKVVIVTHNGIITAAKYLQRRDFSESKSVSFQPYLVPYSFTMSLSIKRFIKNVLQGQFDEQLKKLDI